MDHDMARLKALGASRKRHLEAIERDRPELEALIRAADAAGVPPVELEQITGLRREPLRLIRKPEAREAHNARRRKTSPEST